MKLMKLGEHYFNPELITHLQVHDDGQRGITIYFSGGDKWFLHPDRESGLITVLMEWLDESSKGNDLLDPKPSLRGVGMPQGSARRK